jgi:hypothetical protein
VNCTIQVPLERRTQKPKHGIGMTNFVDWPAASEPFDVVAEFLNSKDLSIANEAQIRFDVIDRVIREVWGWSHGTVNVEERTLENDVKYVDYILRLGNYTIVIEAKRLGATFAATTERPMLKRTGSVLSQGALGKALEQVEEYGRNKNADIVIATNGLCWCYYALAQKEDGGYANLRYPFKKDRDAEKLFNTFSVHAVENESILRISNTPPQREDRLISELKSLDVRVDTNTMADHIRPALNNAFYEDSLLASVTNLTKCFVKTEARTRYDSLLGMHLTDSKPESASPAKRIKRSKYTSHLSTFIESSIPSHAPIVTLIIGQVGVGKTTYLRHFAEVSGKDVLDKQNALWISIDFKELGKEGNPREFIYRKILTKLESIKQPEPFDYKNVVGPAYEDKIDAISRGPLKLIFDSDKIKFDEKISELIMKDYERIEPYVDRVLGFIARKRTVIVVLDNADLYEDTELEASVFSEGLALSKRIMSHVIVSIRDKTFVRHNHDSTFNAYELRKLWLDPPPFRSVLSRRLDYSRLILKNKKATLELDNGMRLKILDLSVFFEIVQRSLLDERGSAFIESLADKNIRAGLNLVYNFLVSGHIDSNKAMDTYMKGGTSYKFPYHKLFQGTILGQWKHFKEERTTAINIFDSRLGSHPLRLTRLIILKFLHSRARNEDTVETPVSKCIELLSHCGCSETQTIKLLTDLSNRSLVRTTTAENISVQSIIVLTKTGGFYSNVLSMEFTYLEECMYDTAIDNLEMWTELNGLTHDIEREKRKPQRWRLRQKRIDYFLLYLAEMEVASLKQLGGAEYLRSIDNIASSVSRQLSNILTQTSTKNK